MRNSKSDIFQFLDVPAWIRSGIITSLLPIFLLFLFFAYHGTASIFQSSSHQSIGFLEDVLGQEYRLVPYGPPAAHRLQNEIWSMVSCQHQYSHRDGSVVNPSENGRNFSIRHSFNLFHLPPSAANIMRYALGDWTPDQGHLGSRFSNHCPMARVCAQVLPWWIQVPSTKRHGTIRRLLLGDPIHNPFRCHHALGYWSHPNGSTPSTTIAHHPRVEIRRHPYRWAEPKPNLSQVCSEWYIASVDQGALELRYSRQSVGLRITLDRPICPCYL